MQEMIHLAKEKPGPFVCPTCGRDLVRADNFWVCPVAFHSKAIPDYTLPRECLLDAAERSWRQMPFTTSLKKMFAKLSS